MTVFAKICVDSHVWKNSTLFFNVSSSPETTSRNSNIHICVISRPRSNVKPFGKMFAKSGPLVFWEHRCRNWRRCRDRLVRMHLFCVAEMSSLANKPAFRISSSKCLSRAKRLFLFQGWTSSTGKKLKTMSLWETVWKMWTPVRQS